MKNFGKALIRLLSGLFILVIVLFFIFFFSTKGDYEPAKTVAQDADITSLVFPDVSFHVEEHGHVDSPLIVVVHDGPGYDSRYLLPLAQLADEYRVVFYDQRGSGLSPRVPENELNIDTMIDDLGRVINHYAGSKSCRVIGHGWGATLAAAYATKHPTHVDKLVLAEPTMLTSQKAKEFLAKTKFRFSFSAFAALGKSWFKSMHIKGPDDQAKGDFLFMQAALADDIPDHPFLAYYCNRDRRGRPTAHWRYSAKSSTAIFEKLTNAQGEIELDILQGVDSLSQKVLFMAGECNALTGPEFQKGHLKLFPNAEMVIVPKAGHMLFSEQTQVCLQTLRDYFEE